MYIMGNKQTKYKVCANYCYFHLFDKNDIKGPLDNDKCICINTNNFEHYYNWFNTTGNDFYRFYQLKHYPCVNAESELDEYVKYEDKKIPVQALARFSREYPACCLIYFCKECYRKYYRGNDEPDINNTISIYSSSYRPIWNCFPDRIHREV